MKQTAALPLVMAALASAVPDVVVKDLPNTCQTFPGAHQVGQNGCEAIFQIYADSTGNAAVDGKHATQADSPVPEAWGSIAIVSDQTIAWPRFKVSSSGYPGIETDAQNPETGDFEWTPIKLNGDVDNQQLLYEYVVAGYPLTPYALSDAATGEEIPGVFLGANGQVTWAFSVGKDQYNRDQYNFRLLANETAPLRGEEFEGFLRTGEQFEGVQ
ncbi:hypothetical protein KVR01_007306 [Diaporthe batatas]|uniref:uncharacterized protein n=1 Tax=Diaporthe batatas TaxID=748121 RepID=UPI001D058E1A|nr:uncharacterized protein KVR01_007306 [Diaporthe batatas]KAG8162828.1 hypothetical protein KVR01_007306 [Diaporthe batatas]